MGTFTRNGAADYTGIGGSELTAAPDEPRWTYASYGILGLLVEDAATNGSADEFVDETETDNFNLIAGSIFQRFEWRGEAGGLLRLGNDDTNIAIEVDALGVISCAYTAAGVESVRLTRYELVDRQRCLLCVSYGVFGMSLVVNGGDADADGAPIELPDDTTMQIGRVGTTWLNGPLFQTRYDPFMYELDYMQSITKTPGIIYGLNADRIIPNVATLAEHTPPPQYEG